MSVTVSTTVAIVLSVVVAVLIIVAVTSLVCVWRKGRGPMPLQTSTPLPASSFQCTNV